jgi:hypothetical protein
MTILTEAEIAQFRTQLVTYPEALAALDVVEECGGYLEDAITVIMMRETEAEPDRGLNEVVEKCRKVVCQEEFRNDLLGGLLGVAIEPVAASVGIPLGIATAVVMYAYKKGINQFCDVPGSTS